MEFLSDVLLPQDPDLALEAATKQYVDSKSVTVPMETWVKSLASSTDITWTAAALVPTMIQTVPVNVTTDKFLVMFTADFSNVTGASNTGYGLSYLYIDGVAQEGSLSTVSQAPLTGFRHNSSQQWIVTGLTPGNHNFEMWARTNQASTNWRLSAVHTRFTVIKLSAVKGDIGPSGTLENHTHPTEYVAKTGDVMTGDLTVHNMLKVEEPAGATAGVYLHSSDKPNTVRWSIYKNTTAESGADAGSNFVIARYRDDATSAYTISAVRSTGVVTVNPPEIGGVAALLNDTGSREVKSLLINGWTATDVTLRRCGNVVTLNISAMVSTNRTSSNFITIPAGFVWPSGVPPRTVLGSNASPVLVRISTFTGSNGLSVSGSLTTDGNMYGCFVWMTNDAWPTSLPGVAS